MKLAFYSFLIFISACSSQHKQSVTFILEEGFSGYIWISQKDKGADNINCRGKSSISISVDSKGIAKLDKSCFDFLSEWTSYEVNLNNKDLDLFDVGTVNNLRVFYYGSPSDYEFDSKNKEIFEIAPKFE